MYSCWIFGCRSVLSWIYCRSTWDSVQVSISIRFPLDHRVSDNVHSFVNHRQRSIVKNNVSIRCKRPNHQSLMYIEYSLPLTRTIPILPHVATFTFCFLVVRNSISKFLKIRLINQGFNSSSLHWSRNAVTSSNKFSVVDIKSGKRMLSLMNSIRSL